MQILGSENSGKAVKFTPYASKKIAPPKTGAAIIIPKYVLQTDTEKNKCKSKSVLEFFCG